MGSSVIVTTDFTVAGHSIPPSFRQALDRLLGSDYLQSCFLEGAGSGPAGRRAGGLSGLCCEIVFILFQSLHGWEGVSLLLSPCLQCIRTSGPHKG